MKYEEEIKTILSGTRLADEIEPSEIAEMIIDGENIDTITEYIQERISEAEIIYYHNAIDFLKKEDASLVTSLELAQDMGYGCKDLNSEKLATILLQDLLSEELGNVISQIQDLIDSL